MKNKTYILFAFLVINLSLNGQNYFPEGTTWHYHAPDFNSGSFSYNKLESKGDSIFNGDTLTYIEGYINCAEGFNDLIKTENKKIYRLDTCDSNYTLIYDFGMNVGDTLRYYTYHCLPQMPFDSMIYVVDSIKPININGNILDQFFISYTPITGIDVGFTIIEGIGGTSSFYPRIGYCDPVGGPLRCYNDSIIGEYRHANYLGSCDTTYVGIEENILSQSTSIFPNPTYGRIQISTENSINNTEIYSLSGQRILATKNREIDLSPFSKGIYLVKISFEKEIVYRKIIKE